MKEQINDKEFFKPKKRFHLIFHMNRINDIVTGTTDEVNLARKSMPVLASTLEFVDPTTEYRMQWRQFLYWRNRMKDSLDMIDNEIKKANTFMPDGGLFPGERFFLY